MHLTLHDPLTPSCSVGSVAATTLEGTANAPAPRVDSDDLAALKPTKRSCREVSNEPRALTALLCELASSSVKPEVVLQAPNCLGLVHPTPCTLKGLKNDSSSALRAISFDIFSRVLGSCTCTTRDGHAAFVCPITLSRILFQKHPLLHVTLHCCHFRQIFLAVECSTEDSSPP